MKPSDIDAMVQARSDMLTIHSEMVKLSYGVSTMRVEAGGNAVYCLTNQDKAKVRDLVWDLAKAHYDEAVTKLALYGITDFSDFKLPEKPK